MSRRKTLKVLGRSRIVAIWCVSPFLETIKIKFFFFLAVAAASVLVCMEIS
jgi:hypothetical protein